MVKIAPHPISFENNLEKRYLTVYDGKIWYHYGFQAAEYNQIGYITKNFLT